MSQYHGDGPDAARSMNATMMFILILAVGVIAAIAVLAWAPWDDDNIGPRPGQGGSDGQQQVQPVVTQQPATAPTVPASTPGSTPSISATPVLPR